MKETVLRIERGAVFKICAPVNTTSVVSSATVWTLYDNRQQTLEAELLPGEDLILGPYINITKFRIETIGIVTIEEIGDDFGTPILLGDHVEILAVARDVFSADAFVDRDDFISGDATTVSFNVKLQPLSTARKIVHLGKHAGGANTVTAVAFEDDLIQGDPVIAIDGNTIMLVPFPNTWRIF